MFIMFQIWNLINGNYQRIVLNEFLIISYDL
jgi:hypothetical protein